MSQKKDINEMIVDLDKRLALIEVWVNSTSLRWRNAEKVVKALLASHKFLNRVLSDNNIDIVLDDSIANEE